MASETNIGWTDGTVNFVMGCTQVGPGCDHCYAAAFVLLKFGIKFGPGELRHVTKSGFAQPLIWQRAHDRGETHSRSGKKIPKWVFACSLSDFFDNEWPEGVREKAWQVIRDTPALRWQIVTKRVGNVAKMLPADWGDGSAYRHVGIILTMVTQAECDRDRDKLVELKQRHGVKWIGLSIEPQLGPIILGGLRPHLDWVITGGESNQRGQPARPYDAGWARSLILQCHAESIPIFVKQLGDNPVYDGNPIRRMGAAGADPEKWPIELRWQSMPKVYDRDPPYQPTNLPKQKELPVKRQPEKGFL